VTFNSWLRKQRRRNDPVGDLARDYIDDCRVSRIPYRSIRSLRSVISIAAGSALDEALEEYRLARELESLMRDDPP